MLVGDVIQSIDARVRGQAHTRDFMRLILSHVQRIVNAGTGMVLDSVEMPTAAYQQVYDLRVDVPEQVHVKAIRPDGVYDVERLFDWSELRHRNRHWFRAIGSSFDTYALVGRDMLLLHPSKPVIESPTVVYVKLLDALGGDEQEMELPAERMPLVVDICECLLLLRERRLISITPAIERIAREIGADIRLPQ